MKNLKNFKTFNDEVLNEGMISWMKKTINPETLDGIMEDIIKDIEENIDQGTLSHKYYKVSGENYFFETNNEWDDDITVIKDMNNKYKLNINFEEVTDNVSNYYIKKLFNLFEKNKDKVVSRYNRPEAKLSQLRKINI